MSFEVGITAVRRVNAPRDVVWQVFADFVAWPQWNPHARQTAVEGRGHMSVGDQLSLELRPLGLPARVRAQVAQAAPGRRVVVSGRWLGITGWQSFTFSEMGGGTLVEARGMLSGWLLIPFYALRSQRSLGRMMRSWLEALAEEAQRRAAETDQGLREDSGVQDPANGLQ